MLFFIFVEIIEVKKWWKDYFIFSKKERIGIIVLLVLIGLVWVLPEIFKKPILLKPLVQLDAATIDSQQVFVPNKGQQLDKGKNISKVIKPFPFDPNTIDAKGWEALGLQPKTISTIQHYIEKGGRFRQPDDLRRIYGIHSDLADQLIPFIDIPSSNHSKRPSYKRDTGFVSRKWYKDTVGSTYNKVPFKRKWETIDINLADSIAFVSLPGIGPTLAQRIIRFRDNLGGFFTINQILEVYGIKDSVFQLIQPRLACTGIMHKISINQADVNTLNKHPYINFQEAKAIVNFRAQHGYFKQPDELLQLILLNDQWLQKIKPYLNFETGTQ
jgi:DNA uptake protein ComE-like DNA-binding protein